MRIINKSISTSEFPHQWKEAIVTPVLKSGNKETLKNYRPVSCLPAGSKLLERIVCNQVTKYFKENNILPGNQHGLRAHRPTMRAWAEILPMAKKEIKKYVSNFPI